MQAFCTLKLKLYAFILINYYLVRKHAQIKNLFRGGGWIQGIILFSRGVAYFREFYNVTFKNRNFQKRGVI